MKSNYVFVYYNNITHVRFAWQSDKFTLQFMIWLEAIVLIYRKNGMRWKAIIILMSIKNEVGHKNEIVPILISPTTIRCKIFLLTSLTDL